VDGNVDYDMRFRLSRPLSLVLLTLAAWTGSAACGGNVVVDSAGGTGATGTGTDTSIQIPDAGSANATCEPTYLALIGNLETSLGCTPSANIPQCTGKALLPDACGCIHVANEAHPDNIMLGQALWAACVEAGCCGPQASVGCSPCPPAPVSGECDTTTSQCVPG
jgi:hypothetical protein